MTSVWQVEHLFATPMVQADLPVSLDLRALAAASAGTEGVTSMPRTPLTADPIVRQVRGLVDRMTVVAGVQGASPPIDWSVDVDAVRTGRGSALAVPPRWDAFWSAFAVIEGHGTMTIADPRLPATMMEAPALRLLVAKDEPYSPEVRLPLPARRVLILPGWMRCTCEAGMMPLSLMRFSFVAPLQGSPA